jgi:hypothetical protein
MCCKRQSVSQSTCAIATQPGRLLHAPLCGEAFPAHLSIATQKCVNVNKCVAINKVCRNQQKRLRHTLSIATHLSITTHFVDCDTICCLRNQTFARHLREATHDNSDATVPQNDTFPQLHRDVAWLDANLTQKEKAVLSWGHFLSDLSRLQ